jgi:hypothetical protein
MEMLSLYDYLKKPAGGELGKKVAEAAMNEKILIGSKQVSNPKYKGEILMYPKDWLDRYFEVEQIDELPF